MNVYPLAVFTISMLLPCALPASSMGQFRNTRMSQQQEKGGPLARPTQQEPKGLASWENKTLGGKQFWTDIRYTSGWRVQQNSESNHCRLLSPKNHRFASGDQKHCDEFLNELIDNQKVKLESGKVVIVLHGLMRTRSSMQPMADYLQQKGNFTTINLQYASSRNKVGEHAEALNNVIQQLGPHVTEINFVGHSLGNLVVRRYLKDQTDPLTGQQGDPRIKRMVMLGPPNQGSRIARILKSSFLFQTIAGVSGTQLSRGWEKLEPTLAIPKFEFGIVAGGQEANQKMNNFILKGKDDFTVSVSEAKLAGASDFLVRPLFHSTMMHQPGVLKATLNFFEHGYFISNDARMPIAPATKSQNVRSIR